MKKFLLASLPLIAMSSIVIAAPRFDTEAPIAYMTDLSSGAVLYQKNADKQIPPASMAKMMTVYVAFDLIEKGKLKLDDKFRVNEGTWKKWNNQGSTMFLGVGDEVSVSDLLHGIVTLSGNDACVVLAEGIAGTEEAFVGLMNKRAKELGMSKSRFGNSNGWPDEGRTMVTAKDLAALGAATVNNFPKLYDDFYGQDEFAWNGIKQTNRNPLIGKVAGSDGLKTGHTDEAGYGFTGSAEQKGRRLVSVLAGLDSYGSRVEESVKFMNWGFNAWEPRKLFDKGTKVQNAEVQLGDSSTVSLVAAKDLFATLPKASDGKISMKVTYDGPIKAPIVKGQPIATLIVTSEDVDQQRIPLVAGEDVGEAGFFNRAWAGLKSLLGLA
ncbi:D-alanyl-D-alanine carboxypeptidase [Parasphingorhabdus flavimaris]|jgi:serine-type D-Ala-D-Ala carboxypeptidase (penicillin-binding protein 5/6)|uniref:serine-type D-Ala-D-Ala carboxypeptidase n=1 Tax=Parasphingorhabdus flavimaris TaxID=266812 RepID=A0ABX2N2E6_9SPHN|nr:D-alanyl-D-alanine carboxypeptidase family protein [Parasphingorhabdus flavimaris]NVD27884.1 D-alanyl-D-alanine carboxypeptidase [Parasphingorhabdus flavimaris]|tara:strand:- start:26703 stop:27845 length:1143 start_codon:yes stop_codon:yes gene_type:complete